MWLLDRCHPRGGFFAAAATPVPGSALHGHRAARPVGAARAARRPARAVPRLRRLALDQSRRLLRHLGRRRRRLRVHLLRAAALGHLSLVAVVTTAGRAADAAARAAARAPAARSPRRAGPLGRPSGQQRAVHGDRRPRAASRCSGAASGRQRTRAARWRGAAPGWWRIRTPTAAGATPSAAAATSARRRSCGRRCRLVGTAATAAAERRRAVGRAWLRRAAGGSTPTALRAAILRRYGKDRTFSVPILTVLALAGKLGADPRAAGGRSRSCRSSWRRCRTRWFQHLSAAGRQLRAAGADRHRPGAPPLRAVAQPGDAARCATGVRRRTQRAAARRCSPTSGGYLEATPLTSFVVMSLAGMGEAAEPGRRRGRAVPRRRRCARTAAGRSTPTSRPG